MFFGDFEEGQVHVLGHARGVAADVERGSTLEPGPEFRAVLQHEVLDVEFFLLVARPGDIELRKRAVRNVAFDFFLIEIVGGAVWITEEEPVFTFGGGGLAVFKKRAEGGDAGAGTDHDDIGVAVCRQAEGVIAVDVNARFCVACDPVREEGGTDAAAFAAEGVITHDADTKVDFAGMCARTGGDRVEPRLEFFQDGNELFGIGEIGGMVDDEIDQIAT